LLVLLVLLVVTTCLLWNRGPLPWKGFEEPDDIQAGREMLADKLTGPRYFQLGAETPEMPHPYISLQDAHGQIERVARKRGLGMNGIQKLESLVQSLAEEPPSRLTGSSRVNVLKLNLALDEMR
jgi:hypothetical protein